MHTFKKMAIKVQYVIIIERNLCVGEVTQFEPFSLDHADAIVFDHWPVLLKWWVFWAKAAWH